MVLELLPKGLRVFLEAGNVLIALLEVSLKELDLLYASRGEELHAPPPLRRRAGVCDAAWWWARARGHAATSTFAVHVTNTDQSALPPRPLLSASTAAAAANNSRFCPLIHTSYGDASAHNATLTPTIASTPA
ncbi:hypothetical protein FRC09_002530 [Ceratobasidium sp. 395]|nr:hypothetical protein FRC09_002530 [Ceratobasidium sp. 395]